MMSTKASETPNSLIPGPLGHFFFGNLWDIDSQNTVDWLRNLTHIHGQ
jgi:hypothetical protein